MQAIIAKTTTPAIIIKKMKNPFTVLISFTELLLLSLLKLSELSEPLELLSSLLPLTFSVLLTVSLLIFLLLSVTVSFVSFFLLSIFLFSLEELLSILLILLSVLLSHCCVLELNTFHKLVQYLIQSSQVFVSPIIIYLFLSFPIHNFHHINF